MFRNLMVMGLILVMLMPAVSSANLGHITGTNSYGCVYRTEFQKLEWLRTDGYTDEFNVRLNYELTEGIATLFSNGEPVSVEQVYGEFVQVRRPSELTAYWTGLYNIAS